MVVKKGLRCTSNATTVKKDSRPLALQATRYFISKIFPSMISRNRRRRPRRLTERRKTAIKKFFCHTYSSCSSVHRSYGEVGKPKWTRELIRHMDEQKNHRIIFSDVAKWLSDSREFFDQAHAQARALYLAERESSGMGIPNSEVTGMEEVAKTNQFKDDFEDKEVNQENSIDKDKDTCAMLNTKLVLIKHEQFSTAPYPKVRPELLLENAASSSHVPTSIIISSSPLSFVEAEGRRLAPNSFTNCCNSIDIGNSPYPNVISSQIVNNKVKCEIEILASQEQKTNVQIRDAEFFASATDEDSMESGDSIIINQMLDQWFPDAEIPNLTPRTIESYLG